MLFRLGEMNIVETALDGVKIIEPRVFGDLRGCFLETFSAPRYHAEGITHPFVQDSLSYSSKGSLRGLHLQNPNSQGKLVMVVRGSALDVAVDVRVGSPNFGRHIAVVLDEQSHRQLWIPRGFAHGFVALSDDTTLLYKCDALYDISAEICIRWNDPELGIDWKTANPILSGKDVAAPLLRDTRSRLPRYEDRPRCAS
jgi:dTDP-4-dehydrorhamnose 3,5-epimerase